MPAPTAAVLLTLAAFQFGAGAGVRTETRGGLIPTGGNIESDPSLDVTIAPRASLTLNRADSALSADYDLRLLRRFFVENAQRFIIMHNGRIGYTDKFGRGWELNADLTSRFGEIDYANADINTNQIGSMFPSTQGTAPEAVSIPIFTLNFNAGVNGRVGRNHSVGFGVNVGHQRPLPVEVEDGQGGTVQGQGLFEQQTNGAMSSSYGYTVSPNFGLTLSGGVGFVTFPQSTNTGQNFTSGNVSGGASYRIGRSDTISGSVGLLLSQGTTGFLASPIGRLAWTKTWASNLQYRINTNLQAGVSGIANALAGNVEPRLDTRFLLNAGFGKDWTVGLSAFLGTPVPITRSGGTSTLPTADQGSETAMGVDLPVAYRISDALAFDFGASAQVSATRFNAMDFQFRSPSITGYVGLTATVGLGP